MKKINKYIYIGIALVAAVAFPGCELETERYDAINTSIFPKTAGDAEALVTGSCYYVFQGGWNFMFNTANGYQVITELTSDIGESTRRWLDILIYGQWTATPNTYINDNVNLLWEGVQRLNSMTLTIDRIEQIDMDEARKKQLIAEVRCGRGFLGFLMYDLFGPVMIADLETLKNPLEGKILPRATDEAMKAFIEADLKAAAAVLPHSYKKDDPNYGRFTRGLCYTLLLKFYLQYDNRWQDAEAAGRELLKSDYGYDLVPQYKDIFSLANEKNEETIYAYNAMEENRGHSWLGQVMPADYDYTGSPKAVNGNNAHKLAWKFMDTFDPDDRRLETIITEYTSKDGKQSRTEGTMLKYGAIPRKYGLEGMTTDWWNQIDFIIYRYADVLTLTAEAIVRNNGDHLNNSAPDGALYLLNRVRTRAIPAKPFTAAQVPSRDAFLDTLMAERARELFWESGARRQDLIRAGKYVEAMQTKAQDAGQGTLVFEGYERFPIPQGIIDEGKGQIEQNEAYR
jgi:hypothetical protein